MNYTANEMIGIDFKRGISLGITDMRSLYKSITISVTN